jgi:hypothetical protein
MVIGILTGLPLSATSANPSQNSSPVSSFLFPIERFCGSSLKLTTSVGSGTFSTQAYPEEDFVGQEFELAPQFRLKDELTLRAYWAMECELTPPGSSDGVSLTNERRCSPSDVQLAFHHNRLWIDPWIAGQIMTNVQLWLPASWESQFNHTILNLRFTGGYKTKILKDKIALGYAFSVQKYFPYRKVRGFLTDGNSEAGLTSPPLYHSRRSIGEDGSVGSGGPMNDNWMLMNDFSLAYFFTTKLSLEIGLIIQNFFRYASLEAHSDPHLPRVGRHDTTWGTLELAYQLVDYLRLSGGITSRQPALTADGSSLRFPFYDFISPESNYTRWYVSAEVSY